MEGTASASDRHKTTIYDPYAWCSRRGWKLAVLGINLDLTWESRSTWNAGKARSRKRKICGVWPSSSPSLEPRLATPKSVPLGRYVPGSYSRAEILPVTRQHTEEKRASMAILGGQDKSSPATISCLQYCALSFCQGSPRLTGGHYPLSRSAVSTCPKPPPEILEKPLFFHRGEGFPFVC